MKTRQLQKKSIFSVAFILCAAAPLLAQVKIGDNPTTINAGSVLELESTNKGLLMPRASLTTTTTWSLAGTATAGMHIYNTNTGITSSNVMYPILEAKIGEYYWDGTGWVALAPVGVQDASVQLSIEKSGANQALPLSVYTLINFTGEDFDKGNTFNLATDKLTVPANGGGYYQINNNFGSSIQAAVQGAFLYVFVNNTLRKMVSLGNTSSGGIAAGGSCTVKLDPGDVVDFRMIPSTNNVTIVACNIGMYLISK